MFFELDDIKRRHSPYFDVYNTFGWIQPPENSWTWNWQRGAMAGVIGAVLNETQILFTENWRLLNKHYEWPKNLKEYTIYARETLKMDNFKLAIKNRVQFGAFLGATDLAARFALFRQINGGWYRTFGSFEVNYLRKIPPTILTAALTSWISVPFEYARIAYYGDKTFPKELQKGYKSYFNALRRIPFELGPYYLFKNCFPFIARNFFQTLTLFFAYDWLKDKIGGVTYRISDFPYSIVKFMNASVATYLACVFSYPWAVTVRQMVELWPKENGVCRFDGNYRKAAVWLWYHEFGSNYYPGLFNNYFWRQAPLLFTSLWVADSLGMFTYWSHDYLWGAGTNSWEDSFS